CSYGTNNYYSCQSAKDKAEHELCELGEFDCSTNATPMSDANNQSGDDNSFHCDGKDIPLDYVCDAYSDCSDGEDEEDCLGSYVCNDGTTIQSEYVCDGLKDCPDNSD